MYRQIKKRIKRLLASRRRAAKAMVMQPEFKCQVVPNKKKYNRKNSKEIQDE